MWPSECCIWEAADPYLYLRTTPEGRVICGGGDEEIADDKKRDALIGRKTAMLQRKLHRLFPKLDNTVDYAWAGAFGETTTGLPIIGQVPGMPHCLVALGYGGNGTTYAAIAADVIAGAIAGRPTWTLTSIVFRTRRRPKSLSHGGTFAPRLRLSCSRRSRRSQTP